MNFIAKTAIIASLLLGATLPAKADVIFDFVGTTYTVPGEPTQASSQVSGQLVIFDEAYASGYTINRSISRGMSIVDEVTALRGISFLFPPERISNNDFFYAPNPMSGAASTFRTIIELVAAPFSLPTGRIFFRDFDVLVDFTLAGATGSGLGGLIGTGNCTGNGCAFTTTTVQSVPEPASLVLFGVGLAGLGLIRRRRNS